MESKRLTIGHVFLVISIIIVFFSCGKDENINQEVNPEVSELEELTLTEKNEMIENYALMLAASMGENELRSTIKSEAQLMVDGDYNVLTKTLENRMLPKRSVLVKELLVTSHSQNRLKSGTLKSGNLSGEEFLERIKKAFPNLQVAIPVHCDEWDTENYIPLVAFLPFDYDEHIAKFITAYDIYGKKYNLSLDEEPSKPVIVVSRSERVDENGKMVGMEAEYLEIATGNQKSSAILKSAPLAPTSLNLMHGDSRQVILEWSDVTNETSYEVWRKHTGETQFWKFATTGQNDNGYVNSWIAEGAKVWYKIRAVNGDGYSAFSPIMATTVSARNDGEWLKIKRMKFSKSALKSVEKWASGAPEIRLRVVKGSETGASTVFTSGRMEPKKRKDIQDEWWNKEVSIFAWYTNVYGTVFTFDWREEDWDDNVTFEISASYEDKSDNGTLKAGGSVKFSGDDGGDHIGNTSVMWWNKKDQIYNLSGFEWQFVY